MNERIGAAGRRTFAAMRFRNYRLYFVSQIVSFSGTWMAMLAQSWLVLELTGSGTALGGVVAMQFLPTLLLAPTGGMIADRFDKRRLITITQSSAAVLALVLGALTATGAIELWMLYVLAALFGTVTALDNPARQTFVMEMVGPDDVSNAVTLNSVVVNGARVIGPAIGGVLIATVGIGTCFLINAASFVAVIVALRLMDAAELQPTERTARGRGQLREGFRYAWSVTNLRTTLIMLAVIGTITYEFTVTLPLLAEFTFGAGSSGLAAMTALMGAGAVVGGLATASAGNPTPARFVVVAAAFGVVTLALAAMPTLWSALVLMPLLGACSVAVIALSNATLQLNSAPMFRGRVMALFSVCLLGSTPIGGPIVGFVGEHASPRIALAVGGLASIGAALYGRSAFHASGEMPRRGDAPPVRAPAPATSTGVVG
ncbi:MFS transporter [Ilumatobacter sp.]|uniref:MFS transporter n=1 Tax=Ilumatobacter sp. TaxID=1967498 RepID=UPI003B526B33